MGQIHQPAPVLPIVAVSSRYDDAIDWAQKRCVEHFGPLRLLSESFAFTETDYYASSMGTDLKKRFVAAERLIDPVELPQIKQLTNQWEEQYAETCGHPEPRPLNLDPGYITAAKLVLASTKDHAHRIYLRDGIYAEVTLSYRHRQWQAHPWTFPDYQRDDYQAFFSECRDYFRGQTRLQEQTRTS